MEHLPEEIVENIFTRVPMRCLMRFKGVSRYWRSKISSKSFADYHRRQSMDYEHAIHLLFAHMYGFAKCSLHDLLRDRVTDEIDAEFPGTSPAVSQIVGCCNGLVCITFEYGKFMLWSPSTGYLKKLPLIDFEGMPSNFGFGFDVLDTDYKVVVIRSTHSFGHAHVYSLKHNVWIKIDVPMPRLYGGKGRFLRGKLYWYEDYRLKSHPSRIVSYDLSTKISDSFLLPTLTSEYSWSKIGVLDRRICVLSHQKPENTVTLWARDENCWKTMVRIPCMEDLQKCLVTTLPLYMAPNGNILFWCNGSIMIYMAQEKLVKKIQSIDCFFNDDMDVFVESFNE